MWCFSNILKESNIFTVEKVYKSKPENLSVNDEIDVLS